MRVALDTHAAIWYLMEDPELPSQLAAMLDEIAGEGQPAFLSAISLVEIIYLAERGRIFRHAYQMFVRELRAARPTLELIPVTADVVEQVRNIPRSTVPDMPDRIIAATALHLGLSLVTRDRRIQQAGVSTIW